MGAQERLELLAFLTEHGCSVEEMVVAHGKGRLFALVGDRLIRPDRDRFDLNEVAELVGQPLERVRALWRAFGLVDVGDKVASPDDVEMLRTALAMGGHPRVRRHDRARPGDGLVARAHWRRGECHGALPVPFDVHPSSGSEVTTAMSFATIAGAVPLLGRSVDTLLRHHLEAARMHFERTDSDDVVGQGGIRLAVGFADLCGFTGMTQRLRMDELSQLMSGFEAVAADVVSDHDGRIVKFIGDAVMYVAPDPVSAVAAAEDLVQAAQTRGLQARAGVASGTVLALDGDYFGPVVNLAARLVSLGEAGDVLASESVVEWLGDRRESQTLGPQQIRGFDEPVTVARLARPA